MMRFLTRRWRHTVFSLMFLPWSALAASNFIVIGQAIDLSGPNASIGRDYVAGIKTCFDALNAAGGIGGRRIQYIVRDDRGVPQAAVKAVAELIERDQVDYLFGGIGDDVVRAVADDPLFRRSGLTLFAPLASSGAAAASGPVLFWRPGYQQEIRHIFAHFAKLGVKDIGVVYQPSPSNRDAYNSLSDEIRERKMTLTATMQIGADTGKLTPQFAADASRMAASRPGFVVVIADTIGTGLFLKEFRKHSAQTFVAGTSLINLDTLRELAGTRAVEWTVFSQVVPNPTRRHFAAADRTLEHDAQIPRRKRVVADAGRLCRRQVAGARDPAGAPAGPRGAAGLAGAKKGNRPRRPVDRRLRRRPFVELPGYRAVPQGRRPGVLEQIRPDLARSRPRRIGRWTKRGDTS